MMKHIKTERLDGLDVARAFAFMIMVLVNFKVVMGADTGNDFLTVLLSHIEGRAAAAFVVLAGIGLGLSAQHKDSSNNFCQISKKSAFLLILGLANMSIFDADILHYYAFYFFLGAVLLQARTSGLIWCVITINIVFVFLMLMFDYEKGWDFNTLSYDAIWTVTGFIRNLFFNGWHPVFPWLSFFVFGIVLSRISLKQRLTHIGLILCGSALCVFSEASSGYLMTVLQPVDPELSDLVMTSPIPPMPLFVLSAMGTTCILLGVCLMCHQYFPHLLVLMGKQSLSLYILHIILGMGVLEAFNLLGGQSISMALMCTIGFILFVILYLYVWGMYFKAGPVETLLRKLT